MPTKTPSKKTRKPTQLDPLKSIRAQLRAMDTKLNVCVNRTEHMTGSLDSIYAQVGKLHSINDKAIGDAYERGQKSRLPAPEPKEPEPWVPKVGDYVLLAEAKIPLEFGMRVKHGTGKMVYWYKLLSGKHKVIGEGGTFLELDRDQFTVISPKP